MTTPIYDFLTAYAAADGARLHMPGHKGTGPLGCEGLDITEVRGADALYEAHGIIGRSEANATALFGSGRTVYSTEGSSQCIRAMLYLALTNRPAGSRPVVVAARNVHKAFVYACALLDLEVVWLYPGEGAGRSLCACPVTAEELDRALSALESPPCAVYLTSPDYLGGMGDIAALARVAHRHGTVLAVDNAHGAYLRFLSPSRHPLDLGADLCCDSAHKTLPVLTGGAYLHISKEAPPSFRAQAKQAMALFGSTSPSYLIMASLDLCCRELAGDFSTKLARCVEQLDRLRQTLTARGWQIEETDPLRLTLSLPAGVRGGELAERLSGMGIETEYAEDRYLVLMATPSNREEDFSRFARALGENTAPYLPPAPLPTVVGRQVMSIRQAIFSHQETLPARESLGRVCASPTVGCPPAIPIALSGEIIGPQALELFSRYGVEQVDVVCRDREPEA